jgi:hypothetical protein
MAGGDDFLIHVAVRGPDHLRHFVVDEITATEQIQHVETNLIFEYYPSYVRPSYLEIP